MEQGLQNVMSSQKDRDIEYCVEVLKSAEPGLATHLAGLLRDGSIQRAVQKANAPTAAKELGKMFPVKLRKFINLPVRFKLDLVMKLNKALRSGQMEPLGGWATGSDGSAAASASAGSGGDGDVCDLAFSPEVLDAAISFALHQDMSNPVPSEHPGSRYENPMMDVCVARARQMGNRLENVTPPTSWP